MYPLKMNQNEHLRKALLCCILFQYVCLTTQYAEHKLSSASLWLKWQYLHFLHHETELQFFFGVF